MYPSIKYATLQLHPGHEVELNTISKTTAFYENDYFIFDEKDIKDLSWSSTEIKNVVRKKSNGITGEYVPLLSHFRWHLN
jgi:hypothetical protein